MLLFDKTEDNIYNELVLRADTITVDRNTGKNINDVKILAEFDWTEDGLLETRCIEDNSRLFPLDNYFDYPIKVHQTVDLSYYLPSLIPEEAYYRAMEESGENPE